ncbi:hypothetical protein [Rhizosaccharibacter radicis]|uniref:Uncharacterized protein n=1 Tax=Rhizosaccharibacter radicis TaxID=2782605 RepID=A0ABT1W139_9PROT|nr:hypothetical protein [Acetobacteraceae bacterium KSS12]
MQMHAGYTPEELATIRLAVPGLDLRSIRALRRAGFAIVPETAGSETPTGDSRRFWHMIPRPMHTAALVDQAPAGVGD